jgi:hypothetical protein
MMKKHWKLISINQDTKFIKKSLSISKYLYPFKRVSTPILGNFFTKDDGGFTADLQNVSFMSLDESKTINKTSKSPHAFAMCSIRTDLLKQENEKIDSL